MLVEPSILYGDDRLWEVVAQVFLADRPAVLLRLELADPVPLHVVNGGVLDQIRIPAVDLGVIGVEYVEIDSRCGGKHADEKD